MKENWTKHLFLAFMPVAFLFLLATRRAQIITYLSNSSLTIKIQLRCNFFLSFLYDNSLRIRFLLEFFLKVSSLYFSHSYYSRLCNIFQMARSLNFHLFDSSIFSTNICWAPTINQILYQWLMIQKF